MEASEKREEKLNGFIESYGQAVSWLGRHRGKLAAVVVVTFFSDAVFLCSHTWSIWDSG